MTRHRYVVMGSLTALILTTLQLPAAQAVTTKKFVLDDAESLSEGELDGTSVHSSGYVTVGAQATRTGIPDTPLAYSLARANDKSFFVGTGTSGAIYKIDNGETTTYAETGQLLVTSLATGKKNTLYAATIPEARIYRITGKGKTRLHVKLPDTEHIWAMVYDEAKDRLLVGTGPNGTIFSVNNKGKAREIFKSDADHIMSLALGSQGDIFAGTSDEALLIRIDKKGKSSVVWDFSGNEVTAIAFHNGSLGVVANKFVDPPGKMISSPSKKPSAKPGKPSHRSRSGKGSVWKIGADGRAELLYKRDDGHFTSIAFTDSRTLYVGSGREGRIYRVLTDATHTSWVDIDERQVLALDFSRQPHAFVTGDAAAFYTLDKGAPKKPTWTSKVLDAKFRSRWGQLTWRGHGKFNFQTRTGNTEEPDDSWSRWSKSSDTHKAIKSPPARFIQIRARFAGKGSDTLHAVELYYLPQNQRAIVRNVGLKKSALSDSSEPHKPSTKYSLKWDVDNPDKDSLQYKLSYRREGQPIWRPMFRNDVTHTKKTYDWETSSLPDGYYIVKVQASDERANPQDTALRLSAISEPIRIDNHPPHVEKLKVKKGKITGRAQDNLGPITQLQFAVDGGPWKEIFPDDQLLDEKVETFSVPTKGLKKGVRILAIRAVDSSANVASAEITTKIK